MAKYTEDDYCDIYANKICDNCGKCLEREGIDTRAIKIEDIAKTVEENKILEDEYKKELEAQKAAYEDKKTEDELQELKRAYEEFEEQSGIKLLDDDEYEDAFDHIESLDDMDFNDDALIDDMTEEIYPGVRRLKKKFKKED